MPRRSSKGECSPARTHEPQRHRGGRPGARRAFMAVRASVAGEAISRRAGVLARSVAPLALP